MKRITTNRIIFLFMMMLTSIASHAQGKDGGTDFMRSNGRIYVVIAVILTILAGLILYLVRLERKLNRLEKEN